MDQPGRLRHRSRWVASAGVLIAVGAVLAGTVMASAAAPVLPRRTPAQLLIDMRHAALPPAMTAVLAQSANLGFPALPDIPGMSSSTLSAASLITGTHTVDIWYAGPQHVRIALPVSFGETDLRVNGHQVWLWDSRNQTATRYIFPATGRRSSVPPVRVPPVAELTPLQAAGRLLAMVGPTTKVTVQGTVTVAGRPAYQLVIAPRTSSSLIGQIVIAVDAKTYLPLRVQAFARGSASPAFQIGFTSLTIGRPAMSNFAFTPPPGAKVKTARLSTLPGVFSGFAVPGGHATFVVPPSQGRVPLRVTKPPRHLAAPGGPSGPQEAIRKMGNNGGGFFNAGAGQQMLGSGWLSVAVLPAGPALAAVSAGSVRPGFHVFVRPASGESVHTSSAAHSSSLKIAMPGSSGQVLALLRTLLKAAAPVHGSWGTGRLLQTSLLSVLITSKGDVLIGAVTPAVLYADAAKVK